MKCDGKYCDAATAKKQAGRGSFFGYWLWICPHCGQVCKMLKARLTCRATL